MDRLPAEAKDKDVFYLTPLQKFTKESKPWFPLVPLGRNILDRFVKDLCHEAGIEGKTNHLLWATGTTRMYRKGIPEKLFLDGTQSIESLRTYERVLVDQERSICHVFGDVTNQQALRKPGMLLDPVSQLQVAKSLNHMSATSQLHLGQMAPTICMPLNPIFNMPLCTVNAYS